MATGGFSPRAASIGAYDSVYIETVLIVFMLLAGTNFSLHFAAVNGRLRIYWRDPEWRFYLGLMVAVTLILTLFLAARAMFSTPTAFRHTLFQVVSLMTTTGFVSNDFEQRPIFAQFTLL